MTEKEITLLSQWLYNKLKASLKSGSVTSEKPITQSKVAESYNATYNTNITNVEIRKAIRYARRLRLPIATDGSGCFIAQTSQELNSSINSLKGRIADMAATLKEIEALQREMYEEETRLPMEEQEKK